jgi:hypothetical protein
MVIIYTLFFPLFSLTFENNENNDHQVPDEISGILGRAGPPNEHAMLLPTLSRDVTFPPDDRLRKREMTPGGVLIPALTLPRRRIKCLPSTWSSTSSPRLLRIADSSLAGRVGPGPPSPSSTETSLDSHSSGCLLIPSSDSNLKSESANVTMPVAQPESEQHSRGLSASWLLQATITKWQSVYDMPVAAAWVGELSPLALVAWSAAAKQGALRTS